MARLPDLPQRPQGDTEWLDVSLRVIYDAIRAVKQDTEAIMAANDAMSGAMTNLESAVNTLLPEIQSEIQDLAAALARIQAAPTPDQVQAQIDRANALAAKVGQATQGLQGDDNPPSA